MKRREANLFSEARLSDIPRRSQIARIMVIGRANKTSKHQDGIMSMIPSDVRAMLTSRTTS